MTRRSSLGVLLVQSPPRTHDVKANVAAACRLLDHHPAAELAVFSELYVHAYALKGLEPVDAAAGGPLSSLYEAARRNATAVVVGVAERDGSSMANTALCIDAQGEIAARYRKVHLFGAERHYFMAGAEYVVVTLAGVRVAPIICYDLDFPEAARAVAAGGAELLVTISANMDPYAVDHALYARVRALENRIPHVYVNAVGQEGRLRFCGGSIAADAAGTPVCALPDYLPGTELVEVPLQRHPDDPRPDYLEERRTDVPVRSVGRAASPAV